MAGPQAGFGRSINENREKARREVLNKIIEAAKSALVLCKSLAGSPVPAVEEYKNALRCRLEVQYAAGLLRVNWGIDANPPRAKTRSSREVYLGQIALLLSESLLYLDSRQMDSALDRLLAADVLLGKVIGAMRRGDPRRHA